MITSNFKESIDAKGKDDQEEERKDNWKKDCKQELKGKGEEEDDPAWEQACGSDQNVEAGLFQLGLGIFET